MCSIHTGGVFFFIFIFEVLVNFRYLFVFSTFCWVDWYHSFRVFSKFSKLISIILELISQCSTTRYITQLYYFYTLQFLYLSSYHSIRYIFFNQNFIFFTLMLLFSSFSCCLFQFLRSRLFVPLISHSFWLHSYFHIFLNFIKSVQKL